MKTSKYLKSLINIVIAVILILIVTYNTNNSSLEVTLNACVDGDTAKFNVGSDIKTTRFLAIDTPESVHPTIKLQPFGKEASTYTCDELKKAKKIILEFDYNSDMYDKYNRLLAWVFVDDKLLQNKIISLGYAEVAYLYGDYKYTTLLLKTQRKAKENKLGIWYNIN